MNPTIRVALVDDHELFLRGLERVLSNIPDIVVDSVFLTGNELLNQLSILDIEVLIIDVHLKDIDPESLLVRIKEIRADLPLLYLTMMRGSRQFRKLERYDIQGYILKDATLEELEAAIRQVASGGTFFSEEINQDGDIILNNVNLPFAKQGQFLSNREMQVMRLICQEYSNAEIAKRLYLSTSTVDTHRKNILKKIGVKNTVGLVKYAIRHKIFEND